MKNVRVGNFFGGLPIKQQREQLKDKDKCPHIIVGTPGRVKAVRALPPSLSVGWVVDGGAPAGLLSVGSLPCQSPAAGWEESAVHGHSGTEPCSPMATPRHAASPSPCSRASPRVPLMSISLPASP